VSGSTQRTSLAQQLERITTVLQNFGAAMHRLMTSVGATRPQVEEIRAHLEALARSGQPSALNAEYRRRQRARVKRRRR
jgi:phage shock protein A